ncbi:dipeptide epimerase [Parasphingorhabdus sp.]|uniref:dipeptide epimerase n=1 Tax=Parasphingorhabdus sp. TaxID=2709688 RepID=UPI003002BB2A
MTGQLTLDVSTETFPFREPFRISGHLFTETEVVLVSLSDGTHVGRGEAAGAYYLGDDTEKMLAEIERVRQAIEAGATRSELQLLLPHGGARNALDCAWWELEAKASGTAVWEIAGLAAEPQPLLTTITLGAQEPAVMAEKAAALTDFRALKLKLTGEAETDFARVAEVRAVRPDCWIGVDANQGYGIDGLAALVEVLLENGVQLLEQPLARGRESDLDGFERRMPFAADESALSLEDVDAMVGRFDVINIKLDKCGGLTEGLAIARRAKQLGLGVMVGNMMGSSLSMAPSFIVGQLCDVVDLDGPTFLRADRSPAVEYADGNIWCPAGLWGLHGS